eukprot:TRINITY_DN56165_c0_g1_i1.p1 TRINITY_DN56165_c0_g1~~TRINITY_DN56165_c0_g1_i1.p1  ORF type:complete len:711 (-),score=154.69 TRINITY_DN56165_c0_g1_i1:82-2214(-)
MLARKLRPSTTIDSEEDAKLLAASSADSPSRASSSRPRAEATAVATPAASLAAAHDDVSKSEEAFVLSPRNEADVGRWIRCFCVYVFDADVGHRLELELPAGGLSDDDRRLLGYLCFPDCRPNDHAGVVSLDVPAAGNHHHKPHEVSDIAIFSLRLRHGCGVARCGLGPLRGRTLPKEVEPAAGDFSFGVACFRQEPDSSKKRGCWQRSLVLLSPLGCLAFLERFVYLVEEAFFKHGPRVLESMLHSVAHWPDPYSDPGVPRELPVLGDVLRYVAPAARYGGTVVDRSASPLCLAGGAYWMCRGFGIRTWSKRRSRRSAAAALADATNVWSKAEIGEAEEAVAALAATSAGYVVSAAAASSATHGASVAAAAEPSEESAELLLVAAALGIQICDPSVVPSGAAEPRRPFTALFPLSRALWALWELALCGEPLLVFALDYPSRVADAVFSITSLIAPVEYSGDYRPYFTIYDGDFDFYKQRAQNGGLDRTAVILGATNPMIFRTFCQLPSCLVLSCASASGIQSGNPAATMLAPKGNRRKLLFKTAEPPESKNDVACSWLQRSPGAHEFTLRPDKSLLRRLKGSPAKRESGGAQEGDSILPTGPQAEARDSAVRRYFFELTLAFLAPFVPYLERVRRLRQSSNPPTADAPALDFDEAVFLAELEPTGAFAELPSDKCLALYSRFIRGANFQPWLSKQLGEKTLGPELAEAA